MTEELRFDGEVAIVTGSGSGLGRNYALQLAGRGARVVCNDLVAASARGTVDEIVASGGTAVAETSSVASPEGGAAIVQAAIDAFGSVQIVINNAGQIQSAPFEDMSVEHFEDVIRTHLAGAFYVTQPAYRYMKSAKYGRVVFTSSSTGLFGSPWAANYAAAKTGVLGLSNVIAVEGAEHGIRSNVILPRALGTAMGAEAGAPYPPEYLAEMLSAFKPFGRHVRVEHVPPLVVYLVHPSCNLTQQIFSVGNGHVGQVFIGVTNGWFAPDPAGSAPEDVVDHLDEVSDLTGFGIPLSATEELRFISEHMPR
jgi:NAD(P)-dependent dehydrogenase (short-subunit alcohol dehydrogenase family)